MTTLDLTNDTLLERLRRSGRDGVRMSDLADLRFVRFRVKELRDAGYRIGEAPDVDDHGHLDTRFLLVREPAQSELPLALTYPESEQGPKPPSRGPARDDSDEPSLLEEGPH